MVQVIWNKRHKGSGWIRLVFAHPFPLNSGAPIASANFISDGKVQLMVELAQLMGACYSRPMGGHNPVPIQSHPLPCLCYRHIYKVAKVNVCYHADADIIILGGALGSFGIFDQVVSPILHFTLLFQCLYYNELPFSEDVRQFTFGSLPLTDDCIAANKKQQPTGLKNILLGNNRAWKMWHCID